MGWSVLAFWAAFLINAGYGAQLYDFENPTEKDEFTSESGSTHKLSTDVSKSGITSLLWSWNGKNTGPIKLKLNLKRITGNELLRGAILFWMYRKPNLTDAVMKISFNDDSINGGRSGMEGDTRLNNILSKRVSRWLWHEQQPPPAPTLAPLPDPTPATVYLNFHGWRAVWIRYLEMGLTGLSGLDSVEFTIEQPLLSPQDNHLYIDLLRFRPKQSRQTRDLVVPPITGKDFYDEAQTWQRSWHWSQVTPPPAHHHDNEDELIQEIDEIERRFHNWYANEKRSSYDVVNDEVDEFRKKRWKSLFDYVDIAQVLYENLTFNADESKIVGPPLFVKVSEYGGPNITKGPAAKLKFTVIMREILLPLALEHHMRSRPIEVQETAAHECFKLRSSNIKLRELGLIKIAGISRFLKEYLEDDLPDSLDCSNRGNQIVPAIKELNKHRLERILKLLDYIEEQGWTEGSGVGSLDHEMNKNGAGFMNALFLIRGHLRSSENSQKLEKLLRTMKWYNDFNEIYQEDPDYVYDGTTADRMRTILLYRLMTILMMPSSRPAVKIRDTRYLKSWAEHALKINKGLGGIIKPDYTGFHHKTFYGPAYTPIAYHSAALLQYLLDGTYFELNSEAKDNLRKGLEVLRTVSVKYSTPTSICGRFPNYTRSIIAYHLPAYAYISYVHPGRQFNSAYGAGKWLRDSKPTVKGAEMFLRLYDKDNEFVNEYLSQGQILTAIYYLNSIGSLDVIQRVKNLALAAGVQKEASPTGHWSKNFASLSIHRRNDWIFAAKGFNNYVWDFETSRKENVYGVFLSYGSLQISNSEDSLKAYDVGNGWDWSRIPGSTSVNLELKNMRTDKARYYNPIGFAGGASIQGTAGKSPQNGIFGMAFKKPDYKITKTTVMKLMTFSFKKSFFFMEELVIAMGSDIVLGNISMNYYAQTTLFQDKLVAPGKNSFITIDGKPHNLNVLMPERMNWTTGSSGISKSSLELTDTNGNKFHIPKPGAQGLHVKIEDQKSKTFSGLEDSVGRYATAWLEHKSHSGASYEYAILVSGADPSMLLQYSVKQQDSVSHVVEFTDLPHTGSTSFGYVFFQGDRDVYDGPISQASLPCTAMTEQTGGILYIALSNPRFKLVKDEDKKWTETCMKVTEGVVGRMSYDLRDSEDEDDEEEGRGDVTVQNNGRGGDNDYPKEGKGGETSLLAEKGRETTDDSNKEMGYDLNRGGLGDDMFKDGATQMYADFPRKNSNDVKSDYQFCRKSNEEEIIITLTSLLKVTSLKSVSVEGKEVTGPERDTRVRIEGGGMQIRFMKLANGFTTEAKFNYIKTTI